MKRIMKRLALAAMAGTIAVGQAEAANEKQTVYRLRKAGTYATGLFEAGATEIVTYHGPTKRLYVTNAATGTIDVLKLLNSGQPKLEFQIALPAGPTSVAAHPSLNLIAVAVPADPHTDNGSVEFYTTDGQHLGSVGVGALPDMVTFTPDGTKVMTANEGEATNLTYDLTEEDPEQVTEFSNPEGSISIITLGAGATLQDMVSGAVENRIGFTDFNEGGPRHAELPAEVRIFGPAPILTRETDPDTGEEVLTYGDVPTVAQDLEPEYIAVSEDSTTAYVTLQENMAVAKIDLTTGTLVEILALGLKDHSQPGNGLDPSDRDDAIAIANWPVMGMIQPDTIAVMTVGGAQYFLTANEGDSRDFEEARVGGVPLAPEIFGEPNPAFPDDPEAPPYLFPIQDAAALGRLKITTSVPASIDDNGNFTNLISFGARSFTIWSSDGSQVFDSGDDFEQIIAVENPDFFNSADTENAFDDRSDDKGPEPEALAVGEVNGRKLAFIGMERVGGIFVYDVTDPANPVFQDYFNSRNFNQDPVRQLPNQMEMANAKAGDISPESIVFIPASKSPTRTALIAASYEISGTVSVFKVVKTTKGSRFPRQ